MTAQKPITIHLKDPGTSVEVGPHPKGQGASAPYCLAVSKPIPGGAVKVSLTAVEMLKLRDAINLLLGAP